MNSLLQEFNDYNRNSRGLSKNSILAYGRDVRMFMDFMKEKSIKNCEDVNNSQIIAFLYELRSQGNSETTINRKLASIRSFFNFLQKKKSLPDNPALDVKAPRIKKKTVEFLSNEEMKNLLDYPGNTMKGIRDRALLEILYASGMRVSELVGINVESVNIHIGFVMIDDGIGKARVIPLGRPARAALEKYVFELREVLLKSNGKANGPSSATGSGNTGGLASAGGLSNANGPGGSSNLINANGSGRANDLINAKGPGRTDGPRQMEEALFLNMTGERLTRQGVWKIIKENAEGAGLNKKITPQIIRNTFAVHMVQNGADIKTLQELMGHEDVAATEIYMEFSKNRIKDVYDNTHPRA